MQNSIESVSPMINILKLQRQRNLTECKICGASARYSYFGAIVCESCKMFFKRNAETHQETLKCSSNNQCEININTRQTCTCCRLKKCFANGMSISLIRPRRYRPNKKNQKQLSKNSNTEIVPISPLTRIHPDSSLLNSDQRNLLSNLINCFDEYAGSLFINHSVNEEKNYYFEYVPVESFFASALNKVQSVVEKNRDFLSLSLNDRDVLLRLTVEHAVSLGGITTLRQQKLLNYSSFYRVTEMIFTSASTWFAKQAIQNLDLDNTFIKIMIAIISFSTLNYTVYTTESTLQTMNIKAILKIQDMYIEIAWLYLLYKYHYSEAVNKFANFIRCLLLLNRANIEAYESQPFKNIINRIIEQNQRINPS